MTTPNGARPRHHPAQPSQCTMLHLLCRSLHRPRMRPRASAPHRRPSSGRTMRCARFAPPWASHHSLLSLLQKSRHRARRAPPRRCARCSRRLRRGTIHRRYPRWSTRTRRARAHRRRLHRRPLAHRRPSRRAHAPWKRPGSARRRTRLRARPRILTHHPKCRFLIWSSAQRPHQ